MCQERMHMGEGTCSDTKFWGSSPRSAVRWPQCLRCPPVHMDKVVYSRLETDNDGLSVMNRYLQRHESESSGPARLAVECDEGIVNL